MRYAGCLHFCPVRSVITGRKACIRMPRPDQRRSGHIGDQRLSCHSIIFFFDDLNEVGLPHIDRCCDSAKCINTDVLFMPASSKAR